MMRMLIKPRVVFYLSCLGVLTVPMGSAGAKRAHRLQIRVDVTGVSGTAVLQVSPGW